MTVKHLQNIQNSKLMGKCTFPTAPDAQGSPGGVRRAQLQAFSLLAAWQKPPSNLLRPELRSGLGFHH